jgi:PAS domain S-box-containing protein
MWVFDLDTLQFLDVNDAAIKKYGYTREEFLRLNVKDIYPAEDLPRVMEAISAMTGSHEDSGPWHHLKKDGVQIEVEVTATDIDWEERRAQLVVANDVTERRRVEEALSEERRLLRTLIDSMPDYIYVKDAGSRFVIANRAVAELMGAKTSEELLGKTDFDYFAKDLASSYFFDEQAIRESGESLVNREERSADPQGNSKWTSTSKIPWRDKHGQVIGIMGIGRDITERKRGEEALRKSEEHFRLFMNNSPTVTWIKDEEGRYVFISQTFQKSLGVRPEDRIGKTDLEVYPRAIAEQLMKNDQAALAADHAIEVTEEAPKADGTKCIWLSYKFRIQDASGQFFVAGIGLDITQQQAADEALKETNQALKALVDASPAAIVSSDCDGKVTMWNPAAERMSGWSEKEALGRPFPMITDERREIYREILSTALRGESVLDHEGLARKKDGSKPLDVMVSTAPLRDATGEVRGALHIMLDITSRKEAEAQLRLQAAALESTANSVVISDKSGHILWANPAFTALTGYSVEEAVGKPFSIFNSGQHPRAFFEQMWNAILSGHVWHGEIVNRRKDGIHCTVEQTITPVRNEEGEIIHFVTIQQDITETKALALQLNQAQKMESVGRLAGGVAHDFNNLLSVIIGYSEVFLGNPKLDSSTQKHAEEIRKAGNRAAELTRQLLAFSRQQVLEPKILNLNSIIIDTERMLQRLIGEDVEIQTTLAAGIGSVKADPGQIEQILMNLAVNARDAMPRGGTLKIETAEAELDEDYARHHPPCVPGWYVVLTVTDSGTGMDENTKAHIFEPFFTTKELGKGTGLGLATVYGVVKQSGGYVWVYSELGHGSVFKVYLPRVDQPVRQIPAGDLAPATISGSETVLVVEDEESVRALICNILQQNGYAVLEANIPALALEIARQHQSIDLVLTDVVMPGMNGPTMAKKLEEIRPGLKVLYMSGYSGGFGAGRGLLEDGLPLLQKPFSGSVLLRRVRESLESQESKKSV